MELTSDIYSMERTCYNLFLSRGRRLPRRVCSQTRTPRGQQPLAAGPGALLAALAASILQPSLKVIHHYYISNAPDFFPLVLTVPSST